MEKTELQIIIERLLAIKADRHLGQQVRRFDQYGIPVCQVTYLSASDLYVVERFNSAVSTEFDQIDLAAIEIYESISEFKSIFLKNG